MRINNLHYDARVGAFEASVDILRDGRLFSYPCKLFGPQSMDPYTVAARLAGRALRMSDTARG